MRISKGVNMIVGSGEHWQQPINASTATWESRALMRVRPTRMGLRDGKGNVIRIL